MVLIVLVGPDLISQDLRFNALPLYLSRPLRRIDYLVGKLGVIAVFLGMVIIVPSLIAYALGLLFSPDLTIVRDTYRVLLASMAYGLVIVVSAGSLILALSSLSRNSRYVALMWLGIWIISGIVGTILESAEQAQRRQASYNRTMAARPMIPGQQGRGDQRRRAQAISEVRRSGREEFEAEELRASKTDWRPLVSYTANLSRVGRQLLGTDACWETFSRFQPPGQRERFQMEWSGPQYPWTWSAGVLAGLFGLSVWILSFPFRSLDRLR
jgi:ABC-2 type transport system permease protein